MWWSDGHLQNVYEGGHVHLPTFIVEYTFWRENEEHKNVIYNICHLKKE